MENVNGVRDDRAPKASGVRGGGALGFAREWVWVRARTVGPVNERVRDMAAGTLESLTRAGRRTGLAHCAQAMAQVCDDLGVPVGGAGVNLAVFDRGPVVLGDGAGVVVIARGEF